MYKVEPQWLWCLHCERVFFSNSILECIYPDCDGHLGDIWEWSDIKESNPTYPETPDVTKRYQMYGGNDSNV